MENLHKSPSEWDCCFCHSQLVSYTGGDVCETCEHKRCDTCQRHSGSRLSHEPGGSNLVGDDPSPAVSTGPANPNRAHTASQLRFMRIANYEGSEPELWRRLAAEKVKLEVPEDSSSESSAGPANPNHPHITFQMPEPTTHTAPFEMDDGAFWQRMSTTEAELEVPEDSKKGHIVVNRLKVYWELQQCIRDDYRGNHALRTALTVTNHLPSYETDAWACSCEEYIKMTWGQFGLIILQDLESALEGGLSDETSSRHAYVGASGCRFHIRSINHEMQGIPAIIKFTGTPQEFTTMSQLVCWIAATFRLPSPGRLCASKVDFMAPDTRPSVFTVQLQPLALMSQKSNYPGSCWYSLFPSTVVASGFSIPRRFEDGRGLQLSFDVMLDLSMMLYHVDLGQTNTQTRGIFFRGLRSMLFPTRHTYDNVIHWHLVPDISEEGLGKHDTPDMYGGHSWLRVSDIDTLRSATAILGYCSDGVIHLGTKERTKIYPQIGFSLTSKETPPPEGSIGEGTVQVSAMGFGAAQLSGNLRYRRGLADAMLSAEQLLYKELLNASKDPIILFDTAPKKERAWLVPRVSLILDMVNQWAQTHKDADQVIKYAEATADGAETAIAVLQNPDYAGLTLVAGDVHTKGMRICDLVRRFYSEMQQREIANAKCEGGSRGITEFGRRRLVGWDLKELVNPPVIVHRQQFNERLRASWIQLTEHAPVYFTQNFGELMSPRTPSTVCEECKVSLTLGGLPNAILIASVRCIIAIARQNGFEDCCVVSDKLLWRFSNESVFVPCGGSPLSCPKQYEDLAPSRQDERQFRKKQADGTFYPQISEDGIVVFRGKSMSAKLSLWRKIGRKDDK